VTGASPPVANLLDLTGRVALVTAGSGGIGAGIARPLAEAGAAVVVHYRGDARGAQAVVECIGTAGGRAVAVGAVVVAAGSNYRLEKRRRPPGGST
jgi:NAD(P)-dependent dehydrogenase (short-subunit alcohol dehydrogenase family)